MTKIFVMVANADTPDPETNTQRYASLVEAIKSNKTNAARRIIENGFDVNGVFKGHAYLHYAVEECNLHLVQLLLDHGAEVSPKDERGITPLLLACAYEKRNSYDLCKLLLEKGADCNAQTTRGVTAFHKALEYQSLKVVKLLLDHGADISAMNGDGVTAVHYAARNPHVDVAEFVLDQGFHIESRDQHDNSPLHHAAMYNSNHNGCELLLSRGALVNAMNAKGGTPLHAAAKPRSKYTGKEADVVQVLLDHGANVTRKILSRAAAEEGSNDVRNALMRHVAKLKFLNLRIDENHRQVIAEEDCYKSYYCSCLQELNNMQVTKFYREVTFFNILLNSDQVLSEYAKNKELVKALEEQDYGSKFPIYFTLMKKRFSAALEKQQLLNAAAEVIGNLFRFNEPAHPANRNILRYLSTPDLRRLCSR